MCLGLARTTTGSSCGCSLDKGLARTTTEGLHAVAPLEAGSGAHNYRVYMKALPNTDSSQDSVNYTVFGDRGTTKAVYSVYVTALPTTDYRRLAKFLFLPDCRICLNSIDEAWRFA